MALLALAVIGLAIIFIYFLVIVRTLGSIINLLTKMEYWATQEHHFREEQVEIRRALEAEELMGGFPEQGGGPDPGLLDASPPTAE